MSWQGLSNDFRLLSIHFTAICSPDLNAEVDLTNVAFVI